MTANIRATTRRYRKVAHRLHCAMPLSGNVAIHGKSLLQSSLNLHFLFGAMILNGGSAISCRANMENSAQIIQRTLVIIQSERGGKRIQIVIAACERSIVSCARLTTSPCSGVARGGTGAMPPPTFGECFFLQLIYVVTFF